MFQSNQCWLAGNDTAFYLLIAAVAVYLAVEVSRVLRLRVLRRRRAS